MLLLRFGKCIDVEMCYHMNSYVEGLRMMGGGGGE
jgi:hypothetical protein